MRNSGTSGFTLMELLITVVLVGIMAGAAMVNYSRIPKFQHCRHARDVLMLIAAGERMYDIDNGAYRAIPPGNWNELNVENPHLPSIPVTFAVPSATATTFTATADIHTLNGLSMSIDQTRVISEGECADWL